MRGDSIGYIGLDFRFILPSALPILVTVGVLTLVSAWNGYLLPLVMLGANPDNHPWLGWFMKAGNWTKRCMQVPLLSKGTTRLSRGSSGFSPYQTSCHDAVMSS